MTSAESVEALASACRDATRTATAPIPIADRAALATAARALHTRAGTRTAAVDAALRAIETGAPLVRFAHQPNLFLQFGLLGQFFALDAVAREANDSGLNPPAVAVYLVVDDDYADDRRFRAAHYPAVSRATGTAVLSLQKQTERLIMTRAIAPRPADVNRWMSILRNCVDSDLAALGRSGWRPRIPRLFASRLDDLRSELLEISKTATSAADFSTIYLSRLVNMQCALPTVFLSLDALRPHMGRHLSFLWERYDMLCEHAAVLGAEVPALADTRLPSRTELPFWGLCACGIRMRLDRTSARAWSADCSRCGKRVRIEIGVDEPLDPELVASGFLRPRVLFDDMLDSLALGAIGGVGYTGSAGHATLARLLLEACGWPDTVDHYFRQTLAMRGMAELQFEEVTSARVAPGMRDLIANAHILELISLGRVSALYPLINLGGDGVRDGLLNHWRRSAPFGTPVRYTNCDLVSTRVQPLGPPR